MLVSPQYLVDLPSAHASVAGEFNFLSLIKKAIPQTCCSVQGSSRDLGLRIAEARRLCGRPVPGTRLRIDLDAVAA
jgi:hypothetical protein